MKWQIKNINYNTITIIYYKLPITIILNYYIMFNFYCLGNDNLTSPLPHFGNDICWKGEGLD